ncbi:protein unc-13 homolog [Primulina huaijiensis]|uniref:protein unc-13 homolog n=1 Tax=Primulina huaijiensis TaxID=1492673 RepID=UPI003CC78305
MASLFRDLSYSRRDSFSSSNSAAAASPPSATSRFIATSSASSLSPLPSPFGDLTPTLSSADLRASAYEIFLSATRSASTKPLTYIPSSNHGNSPNNSSSSNGNSSSTLQRSLTSAAASKMKKALGMRSSSSKRSSDCGSPGNSGSGGKVKKPMTLGELMRVQMRVTEAMDTRIRRGLLRISASQVGRRTESMVLPLELLQQFKASDFTVQEEYEAWQKRNLKMLEAGLLLHPHTPLDKANTAAQRLRQIIQGAFDKPLETGRNNESMQVLRTTTMALAGRTSDGSLESCHWADGYPLNIRLYEMLLEACFDINDETSIVEEIDELMELIKKTWGILGLNQMLHNLCFTWVLFNRYVATGQVENDLIFAADSQLVEVTKDAKITKDIVYSKILNAILTAMLGWTEKRLLAYHETFDSGNIESMQSLVSVGVSAAKILVEDISNEYRRRRKNEVDVTRSRIDTYIRSSLRTAFAQRMEKADSSRRASRSSQSNPLPVLAILAKDVGELAAKEKDMFSPILKRWHSFAAGVAVATLHACYGNELKQFISGITELTPDAVQILRAADKLEKDLVRIAVEDSVDCDDGGKAIIREMPPYEAEGAMAEMVKVWIKTRVERLKEWVDRNLQQEIWNPRANQEGCAPSAVEVLRIVDETLDAFFQLPIPMHPALLPDLMTGLDKCLQYYVTKAKSGCCGSRNTYIPTMPALTRCTTEAKFQWKKKDKSIYSQKKNPQVATVNGGSSLGVPQLCVRINTLHKVRMELEVVEKRIVTLLRNSESSNLEDFSNGLSKKFELTPAACIEAVQQLSEGAAYKIVFHDLGHILWDSLYVGDPASSRVEPFLHELENTLTIVADTVQERVRTRIVADIMRASFEGFLLVLLAGGPTRAFSRHDSQIIEDDFKSLKDIFWANGDGLSADIIDKFATTARDILPLFRTDTESLIERFRRLTLETYGSSVKYRLPLPPTSGQWNPIEPNTLLRVLCHRNDETASKFLKKTYNLPKKL